MNSERMSPQERRAGASLASLFGLRMLGLFLILPLLAVDAHKLAGGDNLTLVGIALGAYGLTQAFLQIPFGMASDRWGRKPVILVGLLLFAAGSFLAGAADNIYRGDRGPRDPGRGRGFVGGRGADGGSDERAPSHQGDGDDRQHDRFRVRAVAGDRSGPVSLDRPERCLLRHGPAFVRGDLVAVRRGPECDAVRPRRAACPRSRSSVAGNAARADEAQRRDLRAARVPNGDVRGRAPDAGGGGPRAAFALEVLPAGRAGVVRPDGAGRVLCRPTQPSQDGTARHRAAACGGRSRPRGGARSGSCRLPA